MSNHNLGSATTATTGGSTSILTIVQVVFIILKLAKIGDIANWSWTKVLIPLWIELGILAIYIALLIIVYIVCKIKWRD